MSDQDRKATRTSERLRGIQPGTSGKQRYEMEMASKLAQAQQSPDGQDSGKGSIFSNILNPLQTFQNDKSDEPERSNPLLRAIHGSQSGGAVAETPTQTQTSELTPSPPDQLSAQTPASGTTDTSRGAEGIKAPDINSPEDAQCYRMERYTITDELIDWLAAFEFDINEIDPILQSGRILTVSEFVSVGNANKNAVVRQIRPRTARIYADQIAKMMLTVDFMRDVLGMEDDIEDPTRRQRLTVQYIPSEYDPNYYSDYIDHQLDATTGCNSGDH